MAKIKASDEELESEARSRGYTITRERPVVTKTFRVELTALAVFEAAIKKTNTKVVDAVSEAFREWAKKKG